MFKNCIIEMNSHIYKSYDMPNKYPCRDNVARPSQQYRSAWPFARPIKPAIVHGRIASHRRIYSTTQMISLPHAELQN